MTARRLVRLGVLAAVSPLFALSAGVAPARSETAASAPSPAQKPAQKPAPRRAAVPAANFLVEWRIQPVDAGAGRGDVVITSGSATRGGASGYGAGAVVVGTARAAAPQSLRVANGHEGEMRFDQSTTRTVYDMSYASNSRSDTSTDAAPAASGAAGTGASRSRSKASAHGAEGHEVVVHHVDGLRVTPRWTRGDTLELELQLTHGAPAPDSAMTGAGPSATREFDFTSTVQLSFDDWQTVATVGDGGEELQVRVTWR